MLTEIILESLLNMDDDTLNAVLESCDAEELDFIDSAMEMQIADRNNPRVQEFVNAKKQLRSNAEEPSYASPWSMVGYDPKHNNVTTVKSTLGLVDRTKVKHINTVPNAKKQFTKDLKKAVSRDTGLDNWIRKTDVIEDRIDNVKNKVTNAAKAATNNVAAKSLGAIKSASNKLGITKKSANKNDTQENS